MALALTGAAGLFGATVLTLSVSAGTAQAATGCNTPPSAASLGEAAPYAEFALGDGVRGQDAGSDNEGMLAFGGNATFNKFFTGSYVASGTRSLVVGGDVSGTVTMGNGTTGTYGGTSTATDAHTPGGPIAGLSKAASDIDFAATFATLRSTSDTWAAEPTTPLATVVADGGLLHLEGTDTSCNVFNLTEGQLAAAQTIFVKVPVGATTLINVPDGAVPTTAYQNMQYWDGAAYEAGAQYGSPAEELVQSRTYLNLPNATTLGFKSAGLSVNVLAPRAAFTFNDGQLDAQVIAASISGDFEGELPTVPTSTPTTSVEASETTTTRPSPSSSTTSPTSSTSSSATSSPSTSVLGSSASRTSGGAVSTFGGVEDESATRTPTLPFTGVTGVGGLLAAGEATILSGGLIAFFLRRKRA